MFCDRKEWYKTIEKERDSKLIVYITGTRPGLETQIANDILPMFVEHLDRIGDVEKISLLLYTNGGDTLAAWSLVNLIRSFCKNFEVSSLLKLEFSCETIDTAISLLSRFTA